MLVEAGEITGLNRTFNCFRLSLGSDFKKTERLLSLGQALLFSFGLSLVRIKKKGSQAAL